MATNTPIENIFELYNLYDLKINAATIKEALDSSVDDKTGNISLFNLYTALNNLIENTIQPDINTLKTAKADKTTVDTLQTELNNAKSIIPKRYIVDTLPEENIDLNGVYYIPTQDTGANMYTEKVYINGKWETIGEPYEIYLKDYYSKKELDTLYYYGDSSIVPTDSSYFVYTTDENGLVTITGYTGSDTDIVIPYEIEGNEVVCIGFEALMSLTSVVIPKSITTIGERAFNAGKFTNITIPDSVTTIGDYAFSHCDNLTSLIIPDSVTSLGKSICSTCSKLTSITFPKSITGITGFSLHGESFVVPNHITWIDVYGLAGSTFTNITIPNSVTRIGDHAFYGCSNLTNITIPDSVTSINDMTFCYCSSLTNITIPSAVTSISKTAFINSSSNLTIKCEKNSYAEQYAIDNNIAYEYYDNESIDHVHINKNTLNEITAEKVAEWDKITTLETQVSDIDIEAERLKYYGDKDIIPSDESYFTVNETGETITGLTAEGKNQTELIIPYNINGKLITTIETGAFYTESSIQTIIIPNSIVDMHSNIFSACYSLNSINIPNGITKIEVGTFRWCESLTTINLPNTIQMIDSLVFSGCTSLVSINIPKDITQIGDNTFENCTSLTSIIIPKTVTFIGDDAFKNCSALTIYCEQGSYAETYAKENNIPIVYTDVKPTSINPIVKTAIDEITSINTIYDLGVQTKLTMTLPSGQVGNFIQVDFISGETATTLTVNSSSGLIGFDLIPGINTIYTLYFEYGVTGYDGTTVTYGWRFNYSEYSMDV